RYDEVINKQIPWEWQYLNLCDVSVFWLATYWGDDEGGVFRGNIGPTTLWEYDYYLQEYLKNPRKRTFIAGAPADTRDVKWARQIAVANGVEWHELSVDCKDEQIPGSLVEAIITALVGRGPVSGFAQRPPN